MVVIRLTSPSSGLTTTILTTIPSTNAETLLHQRLARGQVGKPYYRMIIIIMYQTFRPAIRQALSAKKAFTGKPLDLVSILNTYLHWDTDEDVDKEPP